MNLPQLNDDQVQVQPEVDAGNVRLERSLWALFAVILVAMLLSSVWFLQRPRAAVANSDSGSLIAAEGMGKVSDFSLVDHHGRPVTLEDLKGEPFVVNFFFTNCQGQCPMLTARMRRLQSILPSDAKARLVSITADPERDTPEVLARYAEQFGANDPRWLFLTGDQQEIIRLSREGFRLPASEDPNDHSLRLTLVSATGEIRGYFSLDDDPAGLERQVKELIHEAAK